MMWLEVADSIYCLITLIFSELLTNASLTDNPAGFLESSSEDFEGQNVDERPSCSRVAARRVSWPDTSSNSQMLQWASCCTNSPFTTPQPSPSSAHRHRVCTSAVNFLQKASQLYLSLESSSRRRSHALISVPACFVALVYSETKVEKAPLDLLSAVNLKLKHRGLCVIAG